jgi:hypothetical protein
VGFLAAVFAPLACNANSGEQAVARLDTQATAEIAATVSTQVEGKLEAALVRIDKRIEDHSARVTEATQKALVAVSKVDNSTSDQVVNRVLVVGTVAALIMLVASYPVGKVLWLIGRRLRGNGSGPGPELQDQGLVLRS